MRTALLLASIWALAQTSPAALAQFSIFYEGDTAASPATWTRPALEPGPDCTLSPVGVDVPYDVQGLITHAEESDSDENWNYTTWHEIRSVHDFDGVLLVYESAFDPANPCDNLVAQSGETPTDGDVTAVTLQVELEAHAEYYLVTTGYAAADTGPYTNYVESEIWDADLELIGQPDFADLELGAADWTDHWYIFPEFEDGCTSSYSGDMVFSDIPQFVEAFAFEVNISGLYDVGYLAGGDYQFPLEYDGSKAYLYDGRYNRMSPCDHLYARENNRAGGGYYYSYVDYALSDDVWLEAGRAYVLVGQVYHDLEAADYSPYGYTDVGGWGPNGAIVTDLGALPPLDLELDVLEHPTVVTPGSTIEVRVRVANNTDRARRVDAWVELRAADYDWAFAPYEARGTTPPDPVRIPKRFDGTVSYAVDIPKGLSGEEVYLATFALGTYGAEPLAGDIVEFEVSDAAGAGADGASAWRLRRLSALGENAEAAAPAEGVYPNPFTAATTIHFTLDAAAPVTLTVYDVTGREVARPLDGAALAAGPHAVRLDASGLASGVYVYRLDAGAAVTTRRVTLLK